MPFLEEAVSLLEEADIGTAGDDLFAGSDAKSADGTATITMVRETGSFGIVRTQDVRGAAYEQPTAQLVVRAATVALARAKAQDAYDALFITNRAVLGTWYCYVLPMQPPFDMSKDAAGRPRYGFNFRAYKRPSS